MENKDIVVNEEKNILMMQKELYNFRSVGVLNMYAFNSVVC